MQKKKEEELGWQMISFTILSIHHIHKNDGTTQIVHKKRNKF